ncbi:MAG: aldo/keto reductase family protein [Abitibacteriaceae bacterium]|nr:aldo/keto reductase family protein [Abditibacteriaceae bacterium]
MEYRRLGNAGVKVSEVALGSWLTYGGATDDRIATDCIHHAYDVGINFFDTANVYARGDAERIVGAALKNLRRDSYVLATKVFFPMGDGPNDRGLSRKHIFEQCHLSLKRLGTDYIDLYQCHRYDAEVPLEETLRALDDLVTQGKVLYVGVSAWSASQIGDALELAGKLNLDRIVSNQPVYNMLNRDIEKEVLPLCLKEGIGQVVYSPLAQGILTGKYLPGQPPPKDTRAGDARQNQFLNRGQLDDAQLEKVQALKPLAEREGLTLAQMALAWCLRQPMVSSVIIGASRPQQVDENIIASGKKLAEATLREIDEILGMRRRRIVGASRETGERAPSTRNSSNTVNRGSASKSNAPRRSPS